MNICINKIENRITLKVKTGYYLEHLTTETMKLFGSTKVRQQKIRMQKMFLTQKLQKQF